MADACIQRKRAAALVFLLLLDEELSNDAKKRKKKEPTREWIVRREQRGAYHQLVQEIRLEDEVAYANFFRLDKQQFRYVADKIRPELERQPQPYPLNMLRKNISVEERLAVTLRFLATGEKYQSLEYLFRITRQQISSIVLETCEAIYKTLSPEYFKAPETQIEWENIASRFLNKWNFPNGIGAVDGKRILIQQPWNSGSHFYDYKGNNSIVLLAIFGPEYECLWANVGANGRASDATIWRNSDIRRGLSSADNPLNLPKPRPLPGRSRPVPFVLTGDDAFSLTSYLMKPFPQSGLTDEQRIFNYRLSRMRRISENGFGILSSRWRLFRTSILLPPDTVQYLILAALVLHNYLRSIDIADKEDEDGNIIPASWRNGSPELHTWEDFNPLGSNNYSTEAKVIREEFMQYFNLEGAVSWQWRQCGLDK